MKVIVAGSRNVKKYSKVLEGILSSPHKITELVSGACPTGVDKLAEEWAEAEGIKIKRFPARWDKHGRSAGPRRNKKMAGYAQALIAVWDGRSPGTKNMIREALRMRIDTYVHFI